MAEMQRAEDHDRSVSETSRAEAGWGYSNRQESHWPATLAILTAMLLYLFLPEKLTYFPRWVFPALEAALIIPLTFVPRHHHRRADERPWRRMMAITLIAIINAANFLSLGLLISNLL